MDRIRDLLNEFAEKIRQAALEETFESMRAAIGGGPARRAPGPRGVARSTRAKGGKRDPKDLEKLSLAIQGYVKSHPGKRIEEIAGPLRATTKELALPVKKLLAANKIRKTGTRRATRYFLK